MVILSMKQKQKSVTNTLKHPHFSFHRNKSVWQSLSVWLQLRLILSQVVPLFLKQIRVFFASLTSL